MDTLEIVFENDKMRRQAMAKEKKLVESITSMEEDFAQWYTDIVLKAELADYTDTKGCIAIRPYGYAIWENIQNCMDKKFKETGVKNTYFPVLIPESLLQKEKELNSQKEQMEFLPQEVQKQIKKRISRNRSN